MGYKKFDVEGIVSVSPLNLSGELKDILKEQLSINYDGVIDKDIGIIVAITDIIEHSEGEIIPGDSDVFFKVKFRVISFLPKIHEIIPGRVTQATDFGAFINIGPFDGLCHVSQVMPDFNSYNPELPGFFAKETKKTLVVEDKVLTRITNISFKKTLAETKIGLTMRQIGLGKKEWQDIDLKVEKKKEKESKKKETKTKTKKTTKGGKK